MKKGKILILNAPPQTGKDTLVGCLFNEHIKMRTTGFKQPMYDIAAQVLGMESNTFLRHYNKPGWKDAPRFEDGKTVRDLMIGISESLVKPIMGKKYFGDQLANHLRHTGYHTDLWVIPDGGFVEEVEPLIKEFGDRVVIIQLEREGHRDFDGDSRNWINIDGVETHRFDTTDGNHAVISFIKENYL